ncbi:MAG: hypothetical protein Kow00107_10490 [Planctomycetota bacterium]
MKSLLRKLMPAVVVLMMLLPLSLGAEDEEVDPNLPGNPECKICHGTGKVTYGKKAGKEKYILYCSVKDSGKRCNVFIGGWEPCVACEDWPGMQAIFDEHERIKKEYRSMLGSYWNQVVKTGAPVPNVNGVVTKHGMLFTDTDHSSMHSLMIASEECYDAFTEHFSMGGEGSDWDNRHTQGKIRYILVQSEDVFRKLLNWYYDSPYISHDSKAMGRERFCSVGGAGFLGSRLTFKQQDTAHDERGFIKSYSQALLYSAFATEALKRGFPDWIDEGLSNYYQSHLRQIVSWYTVAYGMGNRRDEEYWGRFENWKEGLAKANAIPVAKFDENQGMWKGLIPLETVIRMNITNMPNQAIAQSWAYVHYFMGDGQTKKKAEEYRAIFKEFLKLVGSGVDQEQAFAQLYKADKLSSIETKFRFWLKSFAK